MIRKLIYGLCLIALSNTIHGMNEKIEQFKDVNIGKITCSTTNGTKTYVGDNKGNVMEFDPTTGDYRQKLSGKGSAITALKVTDKLTLVGHLDGTWQCYSNKNGQIIIESDSASTLKIRGFFLSDGNFGIINDGRLGLKMRNDLALTLFNTTKNTCKNLNDCNEKITSSLDMNNYVLMGGNDGTLNILNNNIFTSLQKTKIDKEGNPIYDVIKVGPHDSKIIVTGSGENNIQLWKIEENSNIKSNEKNNKKKNKFNFAIKNIIKFKSKSKELYDIKKYGKITDIENFCQLKNLDDKYFCVVSDGGKFIKIYDVESRECIKEIKIKHANSAVPIFKIGDNKFSYVNCIHLLSTTNLTSASSEDQDKSFVIKPFSFFKYLNKNNIYEDRSIEELNTIGSDLSIYYKNKN